MDEAEPAGDRRRARRDVRSRPNPDDERQVVADAVAPARTSAHSSSTSDSRSGARERRPRRAAPARAAPRAGRPCGSSLARPALANTQGAHVERRRASASCVGSVSTSQDPSRRRRRRLRRRPAPASASPDARRARRVEQEALLRERRSRVWSPRARRARHVDQRHARLVDEGRQDPSTGLPDAAAIAVQKSCDVALP